MRVACVFRGFLLWAVLSSELVLAAAPHLAGPVRRVGVDPIPDVVVTENNSGAYLAWHRAGVKPRVLVHIDSHIDLEWMDDQALAKILAASTPAALAALERDPYALDQLPHKPLDLKNYIYPAIKAGMVREMYWVLPEEDLAPYVDTYRQLLIDSVKRITLEDLRTFRFEDGMIRLQLFGIPLTICRLADLPAIAEPVLLDIDVDYFDPPFLKTRLIVPQIWPEEFIAILRAKGLRADLVNVAYSVREGYLALEYRYLADHLVALLTDPAGTDTGRRHVMAHQRKADLLRAEGKYADAQRELLAALRLAPQEAAIYYTLSLVYQAQGQVDQARRAYEQAVHHNPEYAHAERYLADSYFNKHLYAEALDVYRRVLLTRPHDPYTHYKLGFSALQVEQKEEALEHLRAAVTLAPRVPLLHDTLGEAYLALGDREAASGAFQHAIELDPSFAEAFLRLGEQHVQRGDPSAARQAFARAIALNPSLAGAHIGLGSLQAEAGERRDAAASYATALFINHRLPQAHYLLGNLAVEQGDLQGAITHYHDAVRYAPRFVPARYNLATLYLQQGLVDEAVHEYQQVVAFDPTHAKAHFNLGDIYRQRGQVAEAIAAYQRFLAVWHGDRRFAELAKRHIYTLEKQVQ